MHVVFVESFSKCKKIESILNKNFKGTYRVFATGGHIRELPSKELAINVNNKYKASYVYNKRSTMQIRKKLKNMFVTSIYLATDPDIEGERIAFDVYELLKKEHNIQFKRAKFNEITEGAVVAAFKNCGEIDMNVVHAQMCRRVMDRLIGYKVTPYLWKNVNSKASAGRVISVVVKMLYDREVEILNHSYDSKTAIEGIFGRNEQKIKAVCSGTHDVEMLQKSVYRVTDVSVSRVHEKPGAPYTTATLCRDVSVKLGLSANMCMKLLQNLYQDGYITYIRTDSTRLSGSFKMNLLEFVNQYYTGHVTKRSFDEKKSNVQGAHEAIRPTNLMFNADILSADMKRVYHLIWCRTVACYLIDAEREVQKVTICGEYGIEFEGSVSRLAVPGWRQVYKERETSSYDFRQKIDREIDYEYIEIYDKFSEPPRRYKDHTLIKKIESSGIGRPSTYAYFIEAIKDKKFAEVKKTITNGKKNQQITKIKRNVVESKTKPIEFKEANVLTLSEIGKLTIEYMINNFGSILDYEYTARLEDEVDGICSGNVDYIAVIDKLYTQLSKHLV